MTSYLWMSLIHLTSGWRSLVSPRWQVLSWVVLAWAYRHYKHLQIAGIPAMETHLVLNPLNPKSLVAVFCTLPLLESDYFILRLSQNLVFATSSVQLKVAINRLQRYCASFTVCHNSKLSHSDTEQQHHVICLCHWSTQDLCWHSLCFSSQL